jgi:hypothetical protein
MVDWPMPKDYDFDAAIVHPNRVREIDLHLTSFHLQLLASAMQEQFPALTRLTLGIIDYDSFLAPAPALPDGFLGSSSPRLQFLELDSIPFPALPKLLLSATHLVHLSLWNIHHSGYFSPVAIVTSLAVMANLKSLAIAFDSSLSRLDMESRRPPPPIRTVLPALTRFMFQGVNEYLEDLVAQIDAPLLDSTLITFFHQLIFEIPQLIQFMGRTTRFQALIEAHVVFDWDCIQVEYLRRLTWTVDEKSDFKISCSELNWEHSSLAQVFTFLFPFIYMVKYLYIHGLQYLPSQWQDDVKSMQWLEIFHTFTALENLYLPKAFVPHLGLAPQDLTGGRTTEVSSTLENLVLEGFQTSGSIQEGIGTQKFVAAQQLSGNHITVSLCERG